MIIILSINFAKYYQKKKKKKKKDEDKIHIKIILT